MFRQVRWVAVVVAVVVGVGIGWFISGRQPVFASGSGDRYEDFILTTGAVNSSFSNNAAFLNADLDGVWLLDYRSGKLLASALNRQNGKLMGWGEMDLVKEFEIAPRSQVHFMMTTGTVVKGQSVLYLVETNTGKVGVYSMMANENATVASANGNIFIQRHDQTTFRRSAPAQAQQQQPPAPMQNPAQNPALPNPVVPAGFPK
jgi:hypothetical protein